MRAGLTATWENPPRNSLTFTSPLQLLGELQDEQVRRAGQHRQLLHLAVADEQAARTAIAEETASATD